MIKKQIFIRRKAGKCHFCQSHTVPNWKDLGSLSKFVSERGKILSKMRTGVCTSHQRRLAKAIKRARYLSLLPYVTQVR